jgi:hypothetical protein
MVDMLLAEQPTWSSAPSVMRKKTRTVAGTCLGTSCSQDCSALGRSQRHLLGFRAFSRRFVKSFPCCPRASRSKPMSVHALELRMPVERSDDDAAARGIPVKLSYSDGWRI